MADRSIQELLERIEELEDRLEESEQLIEAIKAGEVDAFAVSRDNQSEVFTLQSGDYAYRVLVEEFGEGALNVTEDGLIVYSNAYFAEMMGISYEKVLGSFISDFVHPGSLSLFEELFDAGKKDRSKGEINLICGARIIPVYLSLSSLQPKLATVGMIISDKTAEKAHEEMILSYQRNLEDKNKELMQSNVELASFTYVASHDLQEPLRKIQTFVDILLTREYDQFSHQTKDYFRRIAIAATRMQNLLLALLRYSRADNSDVLFEPTDLNAIIEDVKKDLSEVLAKNNAVVHASPLPTLKIIPDQFSQLFTNIIGNAVKYRKANVDPVVNIDATMVKGADITDNKDHRDRNFWSITVSDNGVGFDQQHAGRIFELFQRLHTKEKYEGTGIGLAICKKIVQNHHGFISAEGEPDVGSTFHIYMPVTGQA